MASPFPGQNLPPPTDNRGPMLIQATWIMVGIATTVVTGRVCARLKQMKRLQWDDILMILALLCAIIMGGFTNEAVRAGFGRHIYYLTPEQIKQAIKMSYIIGPFGCMTLVFGRVSFAVSLIVLMGVENWRRWLLYFVIVSQFVFNFIVIGASIGACTPVRRYWDRETPGTCLDPNIQLHLGYAQGASNIFADLVIAFMPIFVVSQMTLGIKTKIGLVFLMGLGVFNLAAAIFTLVSLTRVHTVIDVTYVFVVNDIWALVQAYIVIVAASVPFLRPLFRGNKIFTWAYYRSMLVRLSQRSRSSTSGPDRRDDSDSLSDEKVGAVKTLESLPHVNKARFVTTTLKNVGMESEYDGVDDLEAGRVSAKK